MADRLPSAPASHTVGRYLLFDEIASGGMASVHFGRLVGPVGFSRTVAIKRLHAQLAKDPEFVAMFLDEARLVARIRHPNVVPTLDVVQEEGELLLVMEYVQGETLSRLLRRCRTDGELPPIPIIATVLVGVLHGLHAAHEAKGESGRPLNIVHRDVTPQNIVVGADGVPRILDFGVAKATQRSQTTRDGQLKGKVSYMAPEQITSDGVDRRCDLFAAGVVLWEALAGARLFEGETDARVMQKILSGDILPPGIQVNGIPGALDAICLRALCRDPAGRYQTAREMALAIEAASPLAPASEVGEWVERLAHDVMSQRAARVAEVESRSDVYIKHPGEITEVNVEGPPSAAAPPPAPSRRVPVLVAAGLLLVVLVGASAFAIGSRRSGDVGASPSAAAPSVVPGVVEPPVAQRPQAPATSQLEEAAPATPPREAPKAAAPRPAVKAPVAGPKPRTVDCSQPFMTDENGIKHAKPECL